MTGIRKCGSRCWRGSHSPCSRVRPLDSTTKTGPTSHAVSAPLPLPLPGRTTSGRTTSGTTTSGSNYFRFNYFRSNYFRSNYFRSNYSRRNYLRSNYFRSNYFRYGCRLAAAEAVQGDGDALAGTRFERGRASRAERASTGTGSSNRPIGSSASLVEAARNPDVDDRSRVIERDRRVAAISVVNCRRVYGKQSQFAVGSRRQGKRQHCSYSIDILNEDQIQTKLCNIINK